MTKSERHAAPKKSFARRYLDAEVELEVVPLYVTRTLVPHPFSRSVRQELLGWLNEETVVDLEWSVAAYFKRLEVRATRGKAMPAILKSERRLAKKLEAFMSELRRSHSVVQLNMLGFVPSLQRIGQALATGRGRPVDEARRHLELDVGRALFQTGYPLKKTRGGVLAKTLRTVIEYIGPSVCEDDPMVICARVCDLVLLEARECQAEKVCAKASAEGPSD
ncbi:MAG: hypothetical protein AB1806_13925 [Acidobacteriota bacterium]